MKEIPVSELVINPAPKLGNEWMLITAGTEAGGYNTMTASWGHIGSIWGGQLGSATAICYVRPQRYTKDFMDREPFYTLSFYPPEYHKALGYLGSHSGRDEDKVATVGLTPAFGDGFTYFEEAELVLVCRKLYAAPLVKEGFLDQDVLDRYYPEVDLHTMYIGAIEKVLVKE